jgi:hypothetical protein
MDLKPIETVYNGYRFRSRLEARWAVYFDTLGIEYEYEKEGFDLGEHGWYLPDFWLPQVSMWAEVKGKEFTEEELIKAKKLASASHYPVMKLKGIPECKSYNGYIPFSNDDFLEFPFYISIWVHNHGVCLRHGNIPLEYVAPPHEILSGVKAARSARFEYGETPQIIKEAPHKDDQEATLSQAANRIDFSRALISPTSGKPYN